MDLPRCPNCDHELDEVDVARSVRLEWKGVKGWVESVIYSEGTGCPHCNEPLERELFEGAGIPVPCGV